MKMLLNLGDAMGLSVSYMAALTVLTVRIEPAFIDAAADQPLWRVRIRYERKVSHVSSQKMTKSQANTLRLKIVEEISQFICQAKAGGGEGDGTS